MSASVAMTARRYGRLTVIRCTARRNRKREALWRCVCDCGTTLGVSGSALRAGTTRSCGCLKRDGHLRRVLGPYESRTERSQAQEAFLADEHPRVLEIGKSK